MSAVEIIARAASYDQLREVLIARRKQLGLSQLDVDDISGLQTGYTGKIEALCKKMGPLSLTLLLGALNVELALVRAPSTNRSLDGASAPYAKQQAEFRKKRAQKGGVVRMSKMTAKQRREFARQGAKVRWRKWREAKEFLDAKERKRQKREAAKG